MRKYIFIMLILVSASCRSQESNYTEKEKSFVQLFHRFINDVQKNADSTGLKYFLLNYLFINSKLDTSDVQHVNFTEIKNEQRQVLGRQLKTFSDYIMNHSGLETNMEARPARFGADKNIYNALTAFQKENTLVFYDKRSPEKVIGYMLFMPPVNKIIKEPRIWSWTLTYQLGKYMFRSVTGEDGYEYIFGE
jgi:uncharacterized protein YcfL